MTTDLRQLAEAATPGPWMWRESGSGRIDLAAPHGGGTVVMDFCRHNLQGAQPRFATCDDGKPRGKRGGFLMTATEIIKADPDRVLRHPDAEWIAACSPDRILALLDVADKAREHMIAADRCDAAAAFTSWSDLRTALAALGSHQGKGEPG